MRQLISDYVVFVTVIEDMLCDIFLVRPYGPGNINRLKGNHNVEKKKK